MTALPLINFSELTVELLAQMRAAALNTPIAELFENYRGETSLGDFQEFVKNVVSRDLYGGDVYAHMPEVYRAKLAGFAIYIDIWRIVHVTMRRVEVDFRINIPDAGMSYVSTKVQTGFYGEAMMHVQAHMDLGLTLNHTQSAFVEIASIVCNRIATEIVEPLLPQ